MTKNQDVALTLVGTVVAFGLLLWAAESHVFEGHDAKVERLNRTQAIECLRATVQGTTVAQLKCENATDDLRKALR